MVSGAVRSLLFFGIIGFAEDDEFGKDVVQDDDKDGNQDFCPGAFDAENGLIHADADKEGDTDPFQNAGSQAGGNKGDNFLPDNGGVPGFGIKDPELVGDVGKGYGKNPGKDIGNADGSCCAKVGLF